MQVDSFEGGIMDLFERCFVNRKGDWCRVNLEKFCQEGDCNDCQIYLDFKAKSDLTRALITTTDLKVSASGLSMRRN